MQHEIDNVHCFIKFIYHVYNIELMTRADSVLERIRKLRDFNRAESTRARIGGKKRQSLIKAEGEFKQLFPSSKKKGKRSTSTWSHKFVCLANHLQSSIPTTSREKDLLVSAGLGEKRVCNKTTCKVRSR